MNRKKDDAQAQSSFSLICSNVCSGVVSVGIFLLVFVFPLIVHDSYFDILQTKYCCYYSIVLGMVGILFLLSLAMWFVDLKEYKGVHARELLRRLCPKQWKQTFLLPDFAVLIFWLVSVVSTIQSDYRYEAFWGNEGRYTGLFLLTLYVCAYFMITRLWKPGTWLLEVFLFSGMLMCLFGITDYFQMDIMHWRVGISPAQIRLFTSTIGNINTYTAYLGLLMGVAAGMFTVETKLKKVIWYYICTVISFAAIIMGCSENAYLGLAALFGFLPFVVFRSETGIKRYLALLATFFTVVQGIDYINTLYSEKVVGLDSLFHMIAEFKGLTVVVILLWILTAGVYFCEKKTRCLSKIKKPLITGWMIFVIVVIAAALFVIYDANTGDNPERYGAKLGEYLIMTDSWGTMRGYIWRQALEFYDSFPVFRKLVGYGPDTFGILTVKRIYSDMVITTGEIFDSAHNEYLQYLVTIGALGLISYLVFLGSVIWKLGKNWKQNPYMVGIFGAVVCYAAQAVVNINLPIAAPSFWLLLSIGVALYRNTKETVA